MHARHVRPALAVIAVALVAVFTLHAQDKTKEPVKDFKDAKAFKVLRIVDGDTIEIEMDGKPVKVRLIGVDTPETVHPTKPVQEYGKEASRFTSNMLKGESVFLEYDQQKTDKYDRTLAYVYRSPDGLFVNLEIVRQGYGHAYTKYPFKYMDLFRSHERQAREASRGLWASDVPIEGKDTKPEPAKAEDKKPVGTTVYITDTGKKYHRSDCRHLAKSMHAISLEDAVKQGYEPCKVCGPPVK